MDPFGDALLAVRLLKRDPAGLGGMILRGAGPGRDAVLAELGPMRRLPVGIDDEALIGGRDLAATLAGQGGTVRPGLLAQADGGLLLVSMAERMSDAVAARIASVMDIGEVVIERDGAGARHPARFGLVLLDDGQGKERVPDRLAERLAFRFDLSDVRLMEQAPVTPALSRGTASSSNIAPVSGTPGQARGDGIRALASVSLALGIDSVRAPVMASRVASGLAELENRAEPNEADIATAACLVLAHRATRMPSAAEDDAPPPPPSSSDGESQIGDTLDDVVLEAVTAALPPDVLAAIAAGAGRCTSNSSGGGERRKSPMRGRPLGARAGLPRGGARLALIDTLRAAAPWQKLRGADLASGDRIAIRRDDLRIKRFETRADATTIFAVDASGSAAAARLGEAKGAVELLLAEAYVKRTEVALISFRGDSAEVLLPPTRSLTRARRSLADLPGGGGTPLAAGIDAARLLGEAVRGKGRTPFVVLLSDGRGNVGAEATMPAAKAFGASGLGAVFVDISNRPRSEGAELAAAMRARYLPLPRADAVGLRDAVKAAQ
ncbi:magnesium chelatase subunit D [Sphingomonas sp. SUN039]|uniref:magnesium chelatase subunit D n=1 Tax=Sphingomonas sp. SUN039 TaxID=2937787 RepID=UPI0021640ED5|nr:magnesium chelatase subunit D [Sphingomonas sp. SUN039]UVO54139.1 magnesium chelatase subunit D [Sphingomonas sp. SUN039]